MDFRTRSTRRRARRTAVALVALGMGVATLSVVGAPGAVAAPKRADLQVSKVGKPPASVRYGDSFGLGAVVANRGRAAAKRSQLRVHLSRDTSVGRGDVVGATVPVKRIPARRSKTVSGRVRVPADARGTYWVIACADATRKVRESRERNNCRVAGKITVDAAIKAELSGTLTFVDEGQEDNGSGRTENWRRTATARIRIAVAGDPSARPTFTSTGSTYTRTGRRHVRDVDPSCLTETIRTETGEGSLSSYPSEIYGHFTRTDLSGVRVGLHIPATWTETTTRTPQREDGCVEFGGTTMGRGIVIHSVELKEVATTASAITYRVVGWTEEMGMKSEWEKLTGQLVLRLR